VGAGGREWRVSVLERRMSERRERILESARGLIEAEGYGRLTMRDLAEASGVTVPTIYNLIGNKEQVLLAAVEEQTRSFVTALERAHGDLIEVVEAAVRHMLRRPTYYRSLLLVLASADEAAAARRYVWRVLGDQIDRALADMREADEIAGWIDLEALAERLHAHFDIASIEWARGTLTGASFRAAALFDVATTMLGITSGGMASRFERVARDHQKSARRGPGGSASRGRAA